MAWDITVLAALLGLATGLALIASLHKNAVIRELKEELDEIIASRDWWRNEAAAHKAAYLQSKSDKWSLDWPKLVDPQPADDALAQQECEASNTVSPRWTVHGVGP